MASVFFCTTPPTEIDYSISNGRVRRFELLGVKLFDEKDGTSIDGWKTELTKFVIGKNLTIDKDGFGLHAFIFWMQDEGLLPDAESYGGNDD